MERDLQQIKEEVKARTDLVDIIGRYTRLKKAGKNWTGLCPFHADKKPSFSVSPLGFYKCWSCGESGDVFTFVQKKENLDFIEALEMLAKRAGVPFERKAANPEQASEREQLYELNALAVTFFQERLTKSPVAQEYLAKRGLLKTTQEQWDIGFAPDDWEALVFFLQNRRSNLELAAKAGLIKTRQGDRGGYYDTFRNRLMFPIHDVNGRVVAFGGRAMGDDPAKYLNTEQTPIFDKSRTLYGLYFARKKLGTDTPPVFVEGYVDVITTHQAGFTQCVATLGTSMTEEHARMLVRYSPKVIICYDADSAGIKATLRGSSVWESVGVEGAEVRIARLPAGDDPDSILRRGETAAFQTALDNAVPRVDFQIELALQKYDTATSDGQDAALKEIVPILATIPTLTTRDRYAQRLAYLHPSHAYNVGRAIEQILADVATYARTLSARDKGYPLSEDTNRGTLREPPGPPTYRPPSADQWGRTDAGPALPRYVPKDERQTGNGFRKQWNKNGRRDDGRANQQSDPSAPPLVAPVLTGVEKAERQLLRACFTAEWRAFVLSRLSRELLVTEHGSSLFSLLARTPANSEGGLDALPLLQRLESEENTDIANLPDSRASVSQAGIEVAQNIPQFAKLSWYLREVLEDFASLLSNEPLNEAVVSDCIRRLYKHREERQQQELVAVLQRAETMSPEERQAYIQQYQQKIRELKGSPVSNTEE